MIFWVGWFSLILLSFSSSLNAGECHTVNLSHRFPKTFDQRDIGWCYAYSASDLLSYKFRENLKGQSLSPLHIALLYNKNEAAKFNKEGGKVKGAVSLASLPFRADDSTGFYRGICLSTVDQKISSFQPHRGVKQQFYQLEQLKKKYDEAVLSGDSSSFEEAYLPIAKDGSPFGKLQVQERIQLFSRSDFRSIGLNYLNSVCFDDHRFSAPEIVYPVSIDLGDEISRVQKKGPAITTRIKNSSQLLDFVDEQLDKDNVSSIQYFAGFLKNTSEAKSGDYHSSVAVGREKINGSCHYIIRNSWGGCEDKAGKSQYSKNVSQCKDGYIWISQEKLLKNLEGITYLPL